MPYQCIALRLHTRVFWTAQACEEAGWGGGNTPCMKKPDPPSAADVSTCTPAKEPAAGRGWDAIACDLGPAGAAKPDTSSSEPMEYPDKGGMELKPRLDTDPTNPVE